MADDQVARVDWIRGIPDDRLDALVRHRRQLMAEANEAVAWYTKMANYHYSVMSEGMAEQARRRGG